MLSSAAFTLLLRGAMQVWPIGLAGVFSRGVTLPLLGGWILTRGEGCSPLSSRAMLRPLIRLAVAISTLGICFGSARSKADHGHQRDDADAH